MIFAREIPQFHSFQRALIHRFPEKKRFNLSSTLSSTHQKPASFLNPTRFPTRFPGFPLRSPICRGVVHGAPGLLDAAEEPRPGVEVAVVQTEHSWKRRVNGYLIFWTNMYIDLSVDVYISICIYTYVYIILFNV